MRFLRILFIALCVLISDGHTRANTAIGNIPANTATITRQEVIWLYTLKYKNWTDGSRVKIVILPESDSIHKSFVREVLGMSPSQFQRLIDQAVNSGLGTNIIRAKDVAEMSRIVEKTPYALGYMSEDTIIQRGGLSEDVKILRIVD